MDEIIDPTQPEEVVNEGPGRRLREAREARHLSPEQVAAQLRMQVRVIHALERDDYSGLPGATFVQGYLRSYSRLLGLPEEAILGLMCATPQEQPVLVSTIADGQVEVSSGDLPIRLITGLLFLAMLVGLGWWLSQLSPITSSFKPAESAQSEQGQGLALPQVAEGDDAPVAAQEEGGEAAAPDEDGSVDVQGGDGQAGSAEASTAEVDTAAGDESQEETSAQVVVPVAAATTPPALTVDMPQSLLEMEYQADSWSEVRDAAGRQLVYGLITAGQRLKVRGEAPFKVFLGFADGVTVYYNGNLYDHKTYQRGDVARFRIGKAEHNRPVAGN